MKRTSSFCLCALALLLAACSTSTRRADQAVYDLGAPASRGAPAPGFVPMMLEIRAPRWFDSVGIQYRLAYAEPVRLRTYAQARWAAPPAALLQQRLVRQMPLIPQGQGRRDCALHIDIDDFSQVFDGADRSRGVIRLRLAVLDGGRNRLAEGSVAIDKPSPSPDSPGAVAALAAAVDEAGDEISRWQAGLAGSGHLKGCGK